MVFFNYATMQMAAKIVYYGPGLCGKTTNLQHIYSKTSPQSRGEMVSLETETDRTLFFDLLPIDVGVIGGFKTRLQLYTVPGQVFYNTTRKLVLKGVDGIVFVADSQEAVLEANADSFKNLRENLSEIGLDLDEIPIVVQLNKRDLPNIAAPDTILRRLDSDRKFDYVEAVAARGEGVFETLKLISKLTLRTLRRRMTGDEPVKPAARRPVDFATFKVKQEPAETRGGVAGTAAVPPVITPPSATPTFTAPAVSAAMPQPSAQTMEPPDLEEAVEELSTAEIVESSPAFSDATLEKTARLDARIIADAPIAEPPPISPRPPEPPPPAAPLEEVKTPEPEIDFSQTEKPTKPPEVKHVKVRSSVDIMAELEALRKRATQTPAKKKEGEPAPAVKPKRDLHRTILLQAGREVAARMKNVRVAVSFEDENGTVRTDEQTLEVKDAADARSLSIDLKITLE